MIWRLKSLSGFLICTLVIASIGVFLLTSVAYADLNRNWSLQDVKNIIYKAKMNRNSNWQSAYISELDGQDNNLMPIVNDLNNYNYVYFVVRDSWNTYDIGLTNEPQHWFLYRNCPTTKNTVASGVNIGYSITYDSGNFTYVRNDMSDHTSWDHKTGYNYYGMDIENSNNNIIVYNSGYYSPNDFFNEWVWENSSFYISNNVLSNTQYVSITTIDGNITNIPILFTSNFGTLIDDDYLNYQNDNLDMYYYDNGSWVKKRLFFRIEPGLLNNNSFMTFNWNNNYNRCQLTIKDLYAFKNVLYHYDVQNAGNYQATSYFYIGDNTTSILNGTINTSNLPSNYLDQFNNLDNMINDNNNTQSIIDNTNNGDEVDSIVDDFLGESGEQLAESLGYSPMTNTYANFIYGLIDDICDTLYDSGDVYFDYTLHGGDPYRVYSSDIYLPDGPLKTFISGFLIFGACFIIYRHFKHLIDAFNSADLGIIINYDVDDLNIYYL